MASSFGPNSLDPTHALWERLPEASLNFLPEPIALVGYNGLGGGVK